MTDARPFRAQGDGVVIFVRLTPRGSKDAIIGVEAAVDGRFHLAAKVRAVPAKGAANTALERLIAEWLDVPKGSVSVIAGAASRLKTARIEGDPIRLGERIAARLGRQP